jgi:glycerophosphoryl diester phosphodiesterase
LDAKLSADGEVMVIHDQTVDRTTGGQGKVNALTLAEIKRLEAGSFFKPEFTGEPVPTLDEVFEAVGQRLLINVELTNYASTGDALVEKVVALVRRYHLEERVIFSSFHPLNLIRARRLLPETPVAILALPGRAGWLARSFFLRSISPEFVNPYFSDCRAPYLASESRRVNPWTINDPAELRRLVSDGAAGLITDDPLAGLHAVQSNSALSAEQ